MFMSEEANETTNNKNNRGKGRAMKPKVNLGLFSTNLTLRFMGEWTEPWEWNGTQWNELNTEKWTG